MALTQVPPALLTSTTGTGTTVALSASPTFTGTVTTPGVTFSDASIQTAAASPYVLKNRIINGAMVIDQRNAGAAQTISAGTAPYTIDRWYLYSAGASVTGQRIAGTSPNQYAYRITGNTSNTNITFGQRIESYNAFDLTNQTVTVSFTLSSSSLTTATWNAYYANATDNFTSTTSISSGAITINSTPTRYSVSFNAGANAGNGIGIEFGNNITGLSSGQTFTIQNVQLEIGTSATPFESRLYNQELANCQRYYQKSIPGTTFGSFIWQGNTTNTVGYASCPTLPVYMRAQPTITSTFVSGAGFSSSLSNIDATQSAIMVQGIANATGTGQYFSYNYTASAEL